MTITPGLFAGDDGQTVTQVHILYAWLFVPMEFDYIAESEMYLKFTWKGGIFLTTLAI